MVLHIDQTYNQEAKMSLLDAPLPSDHPMSPGINENNGTAFVPFVLYMEDHLPGTHTKRNEGVRYVEKKAGIIGSDLKDHTTITLASPVAGQMNFAQKTARFTLTGNWVRSTNTNPQPVSANAVIIHSGTDIGEKTSALSRPGLYNLAYHTPSSVLLIELDAFLTALDAASTRIVRSRIFFVQFNGLKFGRGYFTLPT